MCEVTFKNFYKVRPELTEILHKAKFVSIDTEFSSLNSSQKLQNSLFDAGSERYDKLRTTVEQMIPVQVGLTAFTFNPDENSYCGHAYTFYVFPRAFSFIDRKFVFQASSLQFLHTYKFDFNKWVSEGLSYLNRTQEEELIKNKENLEISDSNLLEDLLKQSEEIINKWIIKAKKEDILLLKNVEMFKSSIEVRYFLHASLRKKYKNLYTFEDEEGFKVRKGAVNQKSNDLENKLISDLLGFSEVFRLLTSLQTPLIGHNLLLDLMIVVHNFENPLPKSYKKFKQLIHSLFPTIYDTKSISFDILSSIPDKKRWDKNTLQALYEYFKDGHGRHLALNSPLIETKNAIQQSSHSAGWDSYCTGYIFIRMAHIFAAQSFNVGSKKKFMSSELLKAVEKFKNTVNIIRGDVNYIQLDGDDPVSRRPPWLIIEANKKKTIDINQVTTLLSPYGFVEVKPQSSKGYQAIVAVDNFGSAKRILRTFKSHSDFRIQQYSVLKHSPLVRAILWSTAISTGTILAVLGYLRLR